MQPPRQQLLGPQQATQPLQEMIATVQQGLQGTTQSTYQRQQQTAMLNRPQGKSKTSVRML